MGWFNTICQGRGASECYWTLFSDKIASGWMALQVGLMERESMSRSEENVVSHLIQRAMTELDTSIQCASGLGADMDPSAPDRLAADRAVAAAARQVIALTKALKA